MHNFKLNTSTLMLAQEMFNLNLPYFIQRDILFLGARHGSMEFQLASKLRAIGHRGNICVAEIFRPNAMVCKQNPSWNVIHGDARTLPFKDNAFKIVAMVGGPEHLKLNEIPSATKEIERVASELVIFEHPDGTYIQRELYGNPWEVHRSHLPKEFFEQFGYTCVTGKNLWESLTHVLAYKTLTK